jgi:serine/threonine protein kinase/WD40 repeat protein
MFGPYRLEQPLGRGGMGEVYRAYDTRRSRYVALKRLVLSGDEARARFRRECQVLATLRHPHIVRLLDHGEIEGQPYLATELIEGTDLARLLARGRLEPAYCIAILSQIAAALDAAHEAGVVHRDVKPSNILLARDAGGVDGVGRVGADLSRGGVADRAVLVDFGIARPLATDATTLTRTGEIGTLDYMAPERLTGRGVGETGAGRRSVDGRVDVYALACVLFQCLTGKVPFPAEDPAGKLAAQLNDPPPAPSLFSRSIPPALDVVVATGMDKDPARRYPTAGQLMVAAAVALAGAGELPRPTRAQTTVPVARPGTEPIMRAIVDVASRQRSAMRSTYAGARPDPPSDWCPYPGLRSFGEEEAELFFGRERAVTEVLVRLSRLSAESGPLVVTGASGTGKSSLLRAGVLPALAGAAGPRAGGPASGPRLPRTMRWPHIVMTPGPKPFGTLAARLTPFLRVDPGELASRLHAHPELLGPLCERAAAASARVQAPAGVDAYASGVASAAPRLVLVVDQFEELFTAVDDPAIRERFAAALAHAWPALVMVAVRSDFLERCVRLVPLKPALSQPYLLSPLGTRDLERIITEPARFAGLELEAGLVDRLIADVGAHGGLADDPGALPRLAHALRETWKRRAGNVLTLRGYQETGGVDRAVALTADTMYQRLPPNDQKRLRSALLRMVAVVEGGGVARRRASPDEVPTDLADALVRARLATADTSGVQLAHDALVVAWPRLRQWVDEDRHALLLRQRLGEAVAAWQASGRDPAELYRGARLVAALEWAETRDDLTEAERGFLDESRKLQRRTTRRLQVGIVALTGLLVVALVAGGLAVLARNEAERQAATARHEAAVALSRQAATESLTKRDTDPVRAKRRALKAWRTSHTRQARSALLSNVVTDYPATFDSGVQSPSAVDISPDGRFIAVGGNRGQLGLIDTKTRRRIGGRLAGNEARRPSDAVGVWRPPDGPRNHVGHETRVTDVAFSPDGRRLATVAEDLRIWAVPTGRLLLRIPHVGRVVAWGSDGSTVVTEGMPGPRLYAIGEYDSRTGARRAWLTTAASRKGTARPFRIAFGADGTRLAIGRAFGRVELWDPDAVRLVRSIWEHRRAAVDGREEPAYVAFLSAGPSRETSEPSREILVTGTSSDPTLRLWDARTGEPRGTIADPSFNSVAGTRSGPVVSAADGALLTPDAFHRAVLRLDPAQAGATREAPSTVTTYVKGPARTRLERSAIVDVAAADNGDFVGVLLDGTVRCWRRNSHWHVEPFGTVTDVAFSADGRYVTAASWDGLRTWDVTRGTETAVPGAWRARPVTITYDSKGRLVVGWYDGRLTVTPPADGKRGATRTFQTRGRRLVDLVVSPDGALAAVVLESRKRRPTYAMQVWDLRTGTVRGAVDTETRRPESPRFTPDGTLLRALVRPARTRDLGRSEVLAWRVPDLTPVGGPVRDVIGVVGAFTMTPDGDTLITATDRRGRIQLRDPRTGDVRRAFGRHPAPIQSMAVAPDGRTIATATRQESVIRLWNVETGALIAQLSRHGDTVNDLEFSPDGRLLASGGVDSDVGLWFVRAEDAAAKLCGDLAKAIGRGVPELGCR